MNETLADDIMINTFLCVGTFRLWLELGVGLGIGADGISRECANPPSA